MHILKKFLFITVLIILFTSLLYPRMVEEGRFICQNEGLSSTYITVMRIDENTANVVFYNGINGQQLTGIMTSNPDSKMMQIQWNSGQTEFAEFYSPVTFYIGTLKFRKSR